MHKPESRYKYLSGTLARYGKLNPQHLEEYNKLKKIFGERDISHIKKFDSSIISNIQKERYKNPETRKKISEATKLAMARPETKKKNKENTKKAMWTPEVRLHYLEGRQRYLQSIGRNLSDKMLNELNELRKEVRTHL